jgi:hypothetical protein
VQSWLAAALQAPILCPTIFYTCSKSRTDFFLGHGPSLKLNTIMLADVYIDKMHQFTPTPKRQQSYCFSLKLC